MIEEDLLELEVQSEEDGDTELYTVKGTKYENIDVSVVTICSDFCSYITMDKNIWKEIKKVVDKYFGK